MLALCSIHVFKLRTILLLFTPHSCFDTSHDSRLQGHGFMYVFADRPLGPSLKRQEELGIPHHPKDMPLLAFTRNVAHSYESVSSQIFRGNVAHFYGNMSPRILRGYVVNFTVIHMERGSFLLQSRFTNIHRERKLTGIYRERKLTGIHRECGPLLRDCKFIDIDKKKKKKNQKQS